ncbi:hypothetical protein WKI68_43705 [Streptomyces sp. MS1.HAVA.3]|uniref:RsbT co-antagonist protein RsbRD N-terminal domain-containing protein n=1 Tax=Streptomyces caledonius TaxID=3134107 RepID=A0ABU8UEH6_9ACTN
MTKQWLLQLRPDPDRTVDPVMPSAAVAGASELLGAGPVGWAVQTAHVIATEILEQVPEHGGGQGPVTTLRRSTESAVLATLRVLVSEPPLRVHAMTDETLEGCREFARRGIPLAQVLRAYGSGMPGWPTISPRRSRNTSRPTGAWRSCVGSASCCSPTPTVTRA